MFVCTAVFLSHSGAEQVHMYNHIREQTQRHLDSYARDGLRTLCIAKKVTVLSKYTVLSHIIHYDDAWLLKVE